MLTDNWSNPDDCYTHTGRYVASQSRVLRPEEQLRDAELQAADHLEDEWRHHRELLARIDWEKQLQRASSGIGAATAVDFARRGSWLALCGRNKDNLAATISSCLEAGTPADKVITLIGDLTGKEVCQKTISDVIGYFGRLDVLVNSAGIQVVGSIADLAVEDYDRQMDINVRSVFLLTQLAVPHLVKTKGNVVNVSSVAGLRSFPGIIAYNMSKAALDQMTRCAALELAAQGVRVNAVNPGVIVTEIHRRAGMSEADYASFLERCKTTHALGRPGTADEVAKSIVFLASDDASFITGVTLSVDGGRAAMCPR